MFRLASVLLVLPVPAIALLAVNDGLGLVEALIAAFVIVSFAVAAAGWTIRQVSD